MCAAFLPTAKARGFRRRVFGEIQWHKDNSPQNYIVRNRTIRNEFDKALRESKTELDIISAWMNFDVVDESMQRQFENLLRRGVTIKIVYGIGDMSPDTVNKRNRRTLNVAERLIQRFGNYPNFKMKCTDTHEKLFICDERFYQRRAVKAHCFSWWLSRRKIFLAFLKFFC